jgi:hypothetical protein
MWTTLLIITAIIAFLLGYKAGAEDERDELHEVCKW